MTPRARLEPTTVLENILTLLSARPLRRRFAFLYFVIDFFIANNRDFILFCHIMAEKFIYYHKCQKTSGKNIIPLVKKVEKQCV